MIEVYRIIVADDEGGVDTAWSGHDPQEACAQYDALVGERRTQIQVQRPDGWYPVTRSAASIA